MLYAVLGAIAAIYLLRRLQIRLRLSRAKHPSLRGHAKLSRRMARLVPFYEYPASELFRVDNAPADIAAARQQGFERLAQYFRDSAPRTLALSEQLEDGIPDVQFTNAYRVPFQFSRYVRQHMKTGLLAQASSGTRLQDLDGNWSYDLTGAYGVNLYGYDFYKDCIDKGAELVKALGPVLGPYHPVILDNVQRIKALSGMDEVSFHMSGTEAVMQAVRLACYHTDKSRVVVFCGAYHGWWDGVQPGPGNQRRVNDVYTLNEMSENTLHVLRTRKDIACVLVNPLQALNPNGGANSDSLLLASDRTADYDRKAYTVWLQKLRQVCTERHIVLIFDEVFLGFRLARGGAQEYFGVAADMVTYGKTLGGGLPVGVVAGKRHLMQRFKPHKPTAVCFARGTFNSHPYVMGAMNAFLQALDEPAWKMDFEAVDALWNTRAEHMNEQLRLADLPLAVANMSSIWTLLYTRPSRYNWMLQYYLRAQGLTLAWIGTGRFIFSHNYTDSDFEAVMERIVAAGQAMQADGWWWHDGQLTNKEIKRRVSRELLETALPWLRLKDRTLRHGAGHTPE
jgi:glutamate-1-semialdehyde 2,1-aminomutase